MRSPSGTYFRSYSPILIIAGHNARLYNQAMRKVLIQEVDNAHQTTDIYGVCVCDDVQRFVMWSLFLYVHEPAST